MTVSQLAEALDALKGSMSFHLRVLERAELVRVVRTRRVRGVTEKYYGRTARRFVLDPPESGANAAPLLMRTVAAELEQVGTSDPETHVVATARARLDPDRAADVQERLAALLEEFQAQPDSDAPPYTLAVAFFRSEPG